MPDDDALPPETYLGDGLYARFDGYGFRLRAPRDEGDHQVYLDPHVLESFLIYVRRFFDFDVKAS